MSKGKENKALAREARLDWVLLGLKKNPWGGHRAIKNLYKKWMDHLRSSGLSKLTNNESC